MVNERYFIAIKLKNVQTTSKVARMDKSKNVLRPIFLVTAKGPTAPIKVKKKLNSVTHEHNLNCRNRSQNKPLS